MGDRKEDRETWVFPASAQRGLLCGETRPSCQEEALTMDTDVAEMLGKRALSPQDSPFSQESKSSC